MYQVADQYVSIEAGFHVIELQNEHGNRHLIQIAIGHDSCPLCGHVTLRDHEGIDVKSTIAGVIEQLGESEKAVKKHAEAHGVRVK